MRILSTALVAVGIAAGLAPQGLAQAPAPAAPRTREQLLSAPTPRTAEGRPDLTGVWNRAVPAPNAAAGPRAFYLYDGSVPSQENEVQSAWAVRDADFYWLEIDQEIILKGNRENLPLYKPEHWEQVRINEEYGYERPADPGWGCQEVGIIKRGFPAEIIQMPHKVLLRYGGHRSAVREVAIDGRPMRSEDQYEGLHILGGSTVGRWQGDTLVVETVDFPPDLVWYSTRGWPMSPDAKITERFTRQGDVLRLEATVDDPAFIRPWVLPPMERQITPGALLPPAPTCIELDKEFLSGPRFGERFK
ncbi:MAG TPA: hypothetical protein VHJ58_10330 [Vicinamibacterales bacterium]|nr:hypothetical protein [Vicinamibacterales bacterium]